MTDVCGLTRDQAAAIHYRICVDPKSPTLFAAIFVGRSYVVTGINGTVRSLRSATMSCGAPVWPIDPKLEALANTSDLKD
jgi:hypothetical protein